MKGIFIKQIKNLHQCAARYKQSCQKRNTLLYYRPVVSPWADSTFPLENSTFETSKSIVIKTNSMMKLYILSMAQRLSL